MQKALLRRGLLHWPGLFAVACGHENCVAISVLIIRLHSVYVNTPEIRRLWRAGRQCLQLYLFSIHHGNFIRTYLTCIIQTVSGFT